MDLDRRSAERFHDRAVAWLRERFDEATLWVLATNTRAIGFYERQRWRPDGARKDDDRGSFVLHEVRHRIIFRGS